MSMPIPPAAQALLDQARAAAGAAEVVCDESLTRSARFENNQLKAISTRGARGLGLRVIHQGRVGHASSTDPRDLAAIVQRAIASARYGQQAAFAFPAQPQLPPVLLWDPRVAGLDDARAVAMGRDAIHNILAEFPDADCSGEIEWTLESRFILNTSGLCLSEAGTRFSAGFNALRVHGESFVCPGEGVESRLLTPDLAPWAGRVRHWLRLARREATLGVERLPVIFTPRGLDTLIEALEASLDGKNLQKGLSLFAGRQGQRVMDPRLTLLDDPLVNYAPGSARFDSEGVPTRSKALIQDGVVQSFIYDLQTAGLMNTQPTGNAAGGSGAPPVPGFTNLRLAPGDTPVQDMIRSAQRALLVDEVLGAGQSNILAGDFSVSLELAFLIERGEIAGRVKNAMVAGNALDAFNHVGAISREREWNGDSQFPAIEFHDLSITGR